MNTCYIAYMQGLFSEITGVTLQDLRERTNSDYEQIGNAASMRMAGYGAGALFGQSRLHNIYPQTSVSRLRIIYILVKSSLGCRF